MDMTNKTITKLHRVTHAPDWQPGDGTAYELLLTHCPKPGEPERYVLSVLGGMRWTMAVYKDDLIAESYMQEKFRTSAAVGGVLRWLETLGFTVGYQDSDGREWKV